MEKNKTIIHEASCGKPIYDNEGKNIVIECGGDLGGMDGEFAQCPECIDKDNKKFGNEIQIVKE